MMLTEWPDRPADVGPPAGAPPDSGEDHPPNDYGQQTQSAADEAEFLAQYTGLSEHVRKLIGHDFSDFIKSCTFRGSTCLDSKYKL